MKILDIGTTIAILALALALIPLPDVLIGWFCMFFPSFRSPATRMGDLRDSLESTRKLVIHNKPKWDEDADLPLTASKWETESHAKWKAYVISRTPII